MKDNEVWVLVELPPNGKTVGSKWLFKKKTDIDGNVHIYKARLVAKGFTQTLGIDYEETFSPVVDIRAIRILIAITAYYDYEIWQMNVKTAFLNGYLKYMEQPEGFVNSKYPNRNVPYALVVSSIMYAVRCTRPDVAGDLKRELRVSCYTDAGYLTDTDDLKSQTRYVFVLNGGTVDWKRAKQSIFATSSAEAEYIAAFDAFKEAVWVRKFISGLGVVPIIEEPISMYCDNTGAIAIANESGITKGARHFRVKVHYLGEEIVSLLGLVQDSIFGPDPTVTQIHLLNPSPILPISDEALREYCDKNYHQIMSIIAEKLYQEKAQQEKLKAVKARLNFKEASRPGSPESRRDHSKSPKEKDPERRTVFKRLEKRDTESCYQSSRSKETEIAFEKHRHKREYSRRTKAVSESEGSVGGNWKSKPKNQKSSVEDDLSQPWVCEETNPFIPRICYFDFPRARMPSHIKTYDGSEDPEDHLKIFQAERWAMPTWCHMFNSTLIGNARVWFDDLPKESIDSYDDLRKAFLENYLKQKKCIKHPIEIHNIKQRDVESMEEFVRRYKLECRDVKGAPEYMKISKFMHGITNPELIKRLHDKIPKSIDEMISITTTFLRGEVAASNPERKKPFPSWKQQEAEQKQNFKRENFRNKQRT
nr:reverse transcriptase domain-containing protein [Tanacetum cinerariifolium]